MIEIRGQQASDWQDVAAIRAANPDVLPYLRPEAVRDELAKLSPDTWPLVAVERTAEGERIVARCDLQLGRGRRRHVAVLTVEHRRDLDAAALHLLLREAGRLAERWFGAGRLQIVTSAGDAALLSVLESLGFAREAQLRQAVRVAGQLEDELMLARVSLAAEPADEPTAPPAARRDKPAGGHEVIVRSIGWDDWQAMHAIWAQSSVIWGTLQIPYPSADRNRERIQIQPNDTSWPLVAELDGQVVGSGHLMRDIMQRSHVGHLGMMVHDCYRGQGVGSALMRGLLDLADNWLGLTRLQLEVYTDNAAAIKLYCKSGFETEGLYRAFSLRDGRYVDTLVMGRLKM